VLQQAKDLLVKWLLAISRLPRAGSTLEVEPHP
jgi:hypothetical protein